MLSFNFLHFTHLNIYQTQEGTVRAQLDDPHRGTPPSLSLLTSPFRPLQTVYRPILQIFHILPRSFQLLSRMRVAGAHPLMAPGWQTGCEGRRMYDLECIEIWERFARNYQLQHRRACTPSRAGYNPHSCGLKSVRWIRVGDGEFGEPWTRGCESRDWRQSAIIFAS